MGLILWVIAGSIALPSLIGPEPSTPTAIARMPPIRIAELPSLTALPSITPSATTSPFVAPPTILASPTAAVTIATTVAVTSPPSVTILATSPVVTLAATTPATSIATSAATASVGASPACARPAGWMPYQVAPGDTLFGFVMGAGGSDKLSVDAIMQGNCLTDKLLTLGQVIFLPPGIGAKSPKIEDGPAGGTLLPVGAARTPNCPCTFTIPAGWRLEQIAAAIDQAPVGFSGRDFLAATSGNAAVTGYDFLSSKPAGASLEGFMFPGRYTLSNTTSAADFRNQILSAFGAAIPGSWRSAAGAHGSFYQALVIASIIQRESYHVPDQPVIASVFYNRLNVNAALGSTPTLQYALGSPGDWWPSISASDVHSTSPYNTLKEKGVPPTPIDSPGLTAIQAAIYPGSSPYLYFAASCTGPGEMFAQTFSQMQTMLQQCGG